MTSTRDFLNALLCACATTFLVTLWHRHSTGATSPGPGPAVGLGRSAEASPSADGFIRQPGLPGTLPDAGREAVVGYNAELGKVIRESGDPVVQDLLARITEAFPQGWESTFVLHDAMVVTGSLTDMARLVSVGRSRGPGRRTTKGLEGESGRFQALAEDFAFRWLMTKHPGLGGDLVRGILGAGNHQILPLLGPYNLLDGPSTQKALGIPVAPTPPPVEFDLPEGIRRIRDLQNGTPTPARHGQ